MRESQESNVIFFVENVVTSLEDSDNVESSIADESIASTGNDSQSTTTNKSKPSKKKEIMKQIISNAKDEADEDKEMQKEFAAWQTKVGTSHNQKLLTELERIR